ncbi:tRNA N(3)-methylcytidine methyltransferase METTL6 [Populus alba x Populus x berolinensis]|uniref:tRNA N(3)-methylcytidine methyltransferase METTL6 n=1 Tax=Populus alba x Populus x berolinensis TaxID=444605 RepID=A0AAD6Q034_9ROSI|nr:tRNA N(3)-methylcytidine methyltransferase METTL6 [Populus alba x Populus x berolinensis]
MSAEAEAEAEAEYFSKDFEWETLRQEIEDNPSYQYHLLPFTYTPPSQQQEIQVSEDSKAWKRFHLRHSSGKFFKERRYLLKEFPELVSCKEFSKVLEVGCGNGSSVIPILRGRQGDIIRYMLFDCSIQNRFHPFFCDFALLLGSPEMVLRFVDSCVRKFFMLKTQSRTTPQMLKEGVAMIRVVSYLSRENVAVEPLVELIFVSLIFTPISSATKKNVLSYQAELLSFCPESLVGIATFHGLWGCMT